MATQTLKYTLTEIGDIIFRGFDYEIPVEVIKKISDLAKQVGSPDYVKTPVFKKRENGETAAASVSMSKDIGKKKRRNKGNEIMNDDEFDAVNTFQTTKIETKTGINAEFDIIRSFINKMTDKNYADFRNKIIEAIEKLVQERTDLELDEISTSIFDITSSNRYFSKIYAELYSELSSKFEFIKSKYETNLERFAELFNNIEYVDPNENYNKFCEINKINEKRKSLASFYINLMNCGVITKSVIISITRNLLAKLYEYMSIENKKNEVDELTEIIAILYNKQLYQTEGYEKIEGYDINELVVKIAKGKVKDYKSLSNKALFKFMDLIDM
jgi:hypothetical protein